MSTSAVTLTWRELAIAAGVGVQRRIRSMAQGLTDSYGYNGEEDVWTREINGAAAEMAVAKALGIYWDAGVNTFKLPDVGDLQVRHTVRVDGCLILRSHDSDSDSYVLVVGKPPELTIVGGIQGCDGKSDEWIRDPGSVRPAYFVPQSSLNETF
jgi:hypothetical protein